LLAGGGPKLVREFMDELREEHLGVPPRTRRTPTVRARLRAAYERALAETASEDDATETS
jgi:hypothetical protein